MGIFSEPDYDVVQLLYGVVLLVAAYFVAIVAPGDVYVLTGLIALLLIKDGLPNFIMGAMRIGKAKKDVEMK